MAAASTKAKAAARSWCWAKVVAREIVAAWVKTGTGTSTKLENAIAAQSVAESVTKIYGFASETTLPATASEARIARMLIPAVCLRA
jgi:hypothetical protein